jgi:hypothetical protein
VTLVKAMVAWTGLIWLRIETGNNNLCKHQRICGSLNISYEFVEQVGRSSNASELCSLDAQYFFRHDAGKF